MDKFLIKKNTTSERKYNDEDDSETEKPFNFLETPHRVLKRNQKILLKNSKVNIVNTMKII